MYNLSREKKKYTVSVTMSETLYTREQEKEREQGLVD
jgi:hypothetical protein